MICNEIITKDKMKEYLDSVLINKNNLYLFMEFFDNLKNINKHEKLLFLLYNEYISITDILNQVNNIKEYGDTSGIDSILSEHSEKFVSPYAFIKENLFRDYVTTLTFKHYQSSQNIIAQMDIVYETLTDAEKDLLLRRYEINGGNFYKLIRIQMDKNTIELSEVERTTKLLSKLSSDLSSTETFPGFSDGKLVDFIVSELLKSVLKKIDLGTIH